MHEDLYFKLLTPDDGELIHAMHEACFDVPWTQEAFESVLILPTTLTLGAFVLSPSQASLYLPIDFNDAPHLPAVNKNIPSGKPSEIFVGFMMVSILSGAEAEILTFCVHPDYRRGGIGRQLMTELITSLSLFDCTECYLDVAEDNLSAINLYEQFGFKIAGRRENYYKNSSGQFSSALLMTCNIEK